eukprot:TRINITY_DN277_c1_g1_i2.p1 TRINITY_DN277_c1_g1~~TRINITY_DN277_c1_g1_i2.p1  ORF type:complete len:385 (-),score=90.22 TRINITY_DN277_c1_g1_i2:184-1338(-)
MMKTRSKSPSVTAKRKPKKGGSHIPLPPQPILESQSLSIPSTSPPAASSTQLGASTSPPSSTSTSNNLHSTSPTNESPLTTSQTSTSTTQTNNETAANNDSDTDKNVNNTSANTNNKSLITKFSIKNHQLGTPLKYTALFCTRKLYIAICSGDIPRVRKYVRGADFQNLYCMFKEKKMNLLSIARQQFRDFWSSEPFQALNWHLRRIIVEIIEDSILLGSDLLGETLHLSTHTTMGGFPQMPPGYYTVVEKCMALIEQGANVNHSDEKGHLLSKAIIFNSPELVEALISCGASEAKKVRLYLNMHSPESHAITSVLTIEANSCVELATALFRQNDGLFIVCSSYRSAVVEIFYKVPLLFPLSLLFPPLTTQTFMAYSHSSRLCQ